MTAPAPNADALRACLERLRALPPEARELAIFDEAVDHGGCIARTPTGGGEIALHGIHIIASAPAEALPAWISAAEAQLEDETP